MRIKLLAACLIGVMLTCHFAPPRSHAQDGPYVGGKFQGRIAYSADGNHNDPDDWAASPVALAIFAQGGPARSSDPF
jgi:hypothetical protein